MQTRRSDDDPRNPVDAVNALGAIWSPDIDAYAAGTIEAHQIRCALCQHTPCDCPPFGTPEYLALINKTHGTSFGASADE